MGKTLFGGEKSGTPIETRGATTQLGKSTSSYLYGGGTNPLTKIGTDTISTLFGFDPTKIGLGEAAAGALANPADTTKGLFASMVPFEKRQTDTTVAGLRSGFGTLGGRFGRNAVDAEIQARGELSNQFAAAREQALLQANQQRIAAIGALLSGISGAAQGGTNSLLSFLNPGAPNWQEGIMGDILGAAGNVAASFALPGA